MKKTPPEYAACSLSEVLAQPVGAAMRVPVGGSFSAVGLVAVVVEGAGGAASAGATQAAVKDGGWRGVRTRCRRVRAHHSVGTAVRLKFRWVVIPVAAVVLRRWVLIDPAPRTKGSRVSAAPTRGARL